MSNSKFNELADQYAACKIAAEAAEAQVKALRAEILALGAEEVEGFNCTIKVGLSERNTLDSKAVEAEMGKDWVKARSKTTLVESLRIKAKVPGQIAA